MFCSWPDSANWPSLGLLESLRRVSPTLKRGTEDSHMLGFCSGEKSFRRNERAVESSLNLKNSGNQPKTGVMLSTDDPER